MNNNDELQVNLFEVEEREVVEIPLPSRFVGAHKTNDVPVAPLSAASTVTESRGIDKEHKRDCKGQGHPPYSLSLGQYNSYHKDWGIYSTIWDGGLALMYYLLDRWSPSSGHCDILLDLGSGTGLVGLGVASSVSLRAQSFTTNNAQSSAWSINRVILTDQTVALPLLNDNITRNAHLMVDSTSRSSLPVARILDWSDPQTAMKSWMINEDIMGFCTNTFHQSSTNGKNNTETTASPSILLDQVSGQKQARRILLTGADVVYRPSLFEPLLSTLDELWSFFIHPDEVATKDGAQCATDSRDGADHHHFESTTLECILACQSIRTHLQSFWDAAEQHGFAVQYMAVVDLNDSDKLNLDQAVIHPCHPQMVARKSNLVAMPPRQSTLAELSSSSFLETPHPHDLDSNSFTPREGRIWIVRLWKP